MAPIERDADGAWLSGPREPAFDQPPVEVELFQEVGSLTLTITRNYVNWIDATPASERLDERLAALRTVGWAPTAQPTDSGESVEEAEGATVIDRVRKFPGSSEQLYRIVEDPDVAAVTRVALDAVDILRPAWEPLTAEVEVFGLTSMDMFEAELVDVSRPHWFLVRAPVPPGVRIASLWRDPLVRETPSLTRVSIEAWLADALGQVIAPAHGEWSELRFSAGRAWAGPPGWRADEEELRLHHEAGTVVAPVERDADGAWLSGPREPAFDQPPVEVRFVRDPGSMTLTITRHYGNWIDASPATERLNERLAALRTVGWGPTA